MSIGIGGPDPSIQTSKMLSGRETAVSVGWYVDVFRYPTDESAPTNHVGQPPEIGKVLISPDRSTFTCGRSWVLGESGGNLTRNEIRPPTLHISTEPYMLRAC